MKFVTMSAGTKPVLDAVGCDALAARRVSSKAARSSLSALRVAADAAKPAAAAGTAATIVSVMRMTGVADGLRVFDGEVVGETVALARTEGDAVGDAEAVAATVGDTDALAALVGDAETLAVLDGEPDALADTDGDAEALADADGVGDVVAATLAVADAVAATLGVAVGDAETLALIVDDAVALEVADGRTVKGRKIGLTSRAMQLSSQIDEPDYAPLMDDMFFEPGGDLPFERFIAPRVEVEPGHAAVAAHGDVESLTVGVPRDGGVDREGVDAPRGARHHEARRVAAQRVRHAIGGGVDPAAIGHRAAHRRGTNGVEVHRHDGAAVVAQVEVGVDDVEPRAVRRGHRGDGVEQRVEGRRNPGVFGASPQGRDESRSDEGFRGAHEARGG
jgi:hypothetical protein